MPKSVPVTVKVTDSSWHIVEDGRTEIEAVAFWILSSTVTTAIQVSVCPILSVTVSVILLAPKLAHVKLVWDEAKEAIPKSSVDVLSISFAVIVALPIASSWMVIFWQLATGGLSILKVAL